MLIGLRQHRSNISSTLASNGFGMSTRYFVKLSVIACSLLVIWIPCEGIGFTYRLLSHFIHTTGTPFMILLLGIASSSYNMRMTHSCNTMAAQQ
jgi:hypothetical protein